MARRRFVSFAVVIVAVLVLNTSSTYTAEPCPDHQYEQCTLGFCVCLPKWDIPTVPPIPPINIPGLGNGVTIDPIRILVNPLAYINNTGIPMQGDFVEFVIKEPDKLIQLVTEPGTIYYMPVASAMISGRNAVVSGGGGRVPAHLHSFLRRWYPQDLIDSVRWTGNPGPLQNTLHAAWMSMRPETNAVTLINAVIFRNPSLANDGPLWAHELLHVQQYRDWGVFGFAKQWVDNSSPNGPVEAPGYAREKEAEAAQFPPPTGTLPPGTGPFPPPTPVRFPPGTVLTSCGCWGAVQFWWTRQEVACSSGIAYPMACPGFCPGGGSPWADVCR